MQTENKSECCHSTVSASHLSLLLLLLSGSAAVFQEKTPSLTGVRRHLTGNNISAHGQRLLSYIHASEFGVHRFPCAWKPNSAVLYAAGPWNPITQIPKGTCWLFYKWRSCRRAVDGNVVRNNCAGHYRQTVLLHPEMSVGLPPDKYSTTQASDLPRGTFSSFCT